MAQAFTQTESRPVLGDAADRKEAANRDLLREEFMQRQEFWREENLRATAQELEQYHLNQMADQRFNHQHANSGHSNSFLYQSPLKMRGLQSALKAYDRVSNAIDLVEIRQGAENLWADARDYFSNNDTLGMATDAYEAMSSLTQGLEDIPAGPMRDEAMAHMTEIGRAVSENPGIQQMLAEAGEPQQVMAQAWQAGNDQLVTHQINAGSDAAHAASSELAKAVSDVASSVSESLASVLTANPALLGLGGLVGVLGAALKLNGGDLDLKMGQGGLLLTTFDNAGELQAFGDAPSMIQASSDGNTRMAWHADGKLENQNGPAYLITDGHGQVVKKVFFVNGRQVEMDIAPSAETAPKSDDPEPEAPAPAALSLG